MVTVLVVEVLLLLSVPLQLATFQPGAEEAVSWTNDPAV
jgi:hypothetical protein